jgi:hypothetical protein
MFMYPYVLNFHHIICNACAAMTWSGSRLQHFHQTKCNAYNTMALISGIICCNFLHARCSGCTAMTQSSGLGNDTTSMRDASILGISSVPNSGYTSKNQPSGGMHWHFCRIRGEGYNPMIRPWGIGSSISSIWNEIVISLWFCMLELGSGIFFPRNVVVRPSKISVMELAGNIAFALDVVVEM